MAHSKKNKTGGFEKNENNEKDSRFCSVDAASFFPANNKRRGIFPTFFESFDAIFLQKYFVADFQGFSEFFCVFLNPFKVLTNI